MKSRTSNKPLLLLSSSLALLAASTLACGSSPENGDGDGGTDRDGGGSVDRSALELSPTSIDFGALDRGRAATETLQLTNSGKKGVRVLSAAVDGEALPFSVTSELGELEAGESATIEVTFRPRELGRFEGSLLIRTDEDETLRVSLAGEGIEPGSAVCGNGKRENDEVCDGEDLPLSGCAEVSCDEECALVRPASCDEPDACGTPSECTLTASAGGSPGEITLTLSEGCSVCATEVARVEVRRSTAGEIPTSCWAGVVSAEVALPESGSATPVPDRTGAPGDRFGYRACFYNERGFVIAERIHRAVKAAADPTLTWFFSERVGESWPETYSENLRNYGGALEALLLPNGQVYAIGFQDKLVHGSSSGDVWIKKFDAGGVEITRGWDKRIDLDGRVNAVTSAAATSTGELFVAGSSQDHALPLQTKTPFFFHFDASGEQRQGTFPLDLAARDLAVDASDQLWLVSGQGNTAALRGYTKEGELLEERSLGVTAGEPLALAFGPSGDLYVAGGLPGFVQRWSQGEDGFSLTWSRPWSYGMAHALAFDATGNVYVGGYARRNDRQDDYFVTKFDAAGQPDAAWTNPLSDPSNTWTKSLTALTVDVEGNVYAGGETSVGFRLHKLGPDGGEIAGVWPRLLGRSQSNYDVYLSRALQLLPDGRLLVPRLDYGGSWLSVLNTAGEDAAGYESRAAPQSEASSFVQSLVTDDADDVWMGGSIALEHDSNISSSIFTRRAGTLFGLTSSGQRKTAFWYDEPRSSTNVTRLALDSSGALHAFGIGNDTWARKFDSSLRVLWSDVETSTYNREIVAALDANDQSLYSFSPENSEWNLARLNTNGARVAEFPVLAQHIPLDLTFDSTGAFYIVGRYYSELADRSFVKKFTAGGVEITTGWNKLWSGSERSFATGVAVDEDDSVYVTGFQRYDWYLRKFSPTGELLWEQWQEAPLGQSQPQALLVDAARGKIYVAGYMTNRAASDSDLDLVVVAYTRDGEEAWDFALDGGFKRADSAEALALKSDGTLLVGGHVSQRFGASSGTRGVVLGLRRP